MKIEIKHRISGEVLFSHEQENNSWKITVGLAIKSSANLSFADLSFANLSSTNLSFADLRSADLSFANLSSANLSSADLSFANLSSANLSSADLRSADLSSANLGFANLSSANLRFANLHSANLRFADLRFADLCSADLSSADLLCYGDMKFIFTLQLDSWPVGFTKDILQIGCQKHQIEQWRNFNDEDIAKFAPDALPWWNKWKEFIFTAIEKTVGEQK